MLLFISVNHEAWLQPSIFELWNLNRTYLTKVVVWWWYRHLSSGFRQPVWFSADQLIIQKQKLDFSITEPCKDQFEVSVLIKGDYIIVPSPSTALAEIIKIVDCFRGFFSVLHLKLLTLLNWHFCFIKFVCSLDLKRLKNKQNLRHYLPVYLPSRTTDNLIFGSKHD